MIETLERRARTALATEPGLAFEIALALERHQIEPELTPAAQITAFANPERFIASIASKVVRGRAYDLVRERRPDWPQVLRRRCVGRDRAVPARRVVRSARSARPRASSSAWSIAPWCNRRTRRRCSPGSPSARPATKRCGRRLRCACSSGSCWRWSATSSSPTAADWWRSSESGGTLPRLLPHFTEADAVEALESLRKSTGLSTDRKRSLEDAVMLRFPALRVDRGAALRAGGLDPRQARGAQDAARAGDPQEPPRHRGGARARRPARELRVQVGAPAARVSERPGGRAVGRALALESDRPRPSRSVAGRDRHRGAAARRDRLRAAAHPARAVGERARVRRAVVPVGSRAVAAGPASRATRSTSTARAIAWWRSRRRGSEQAARAGATASGEAEARQPPDRPPAPRRRARRRPDRAATDSRSRERAPAPPAPGGSATRSRSARARAADLPATTRRHERRTRVRPPRRGRTRRARCRRARPAVAAFGLALPVAA